MPCNTRAPLSTPQALVADYAALMCGGAGAGDNLLMRYDAEIVMHLLADKASAAAPAVSV